MIKVRQMGVHELTPYENNPRVNEDAVDAVASSIREFGWKVPIVADKDGVIISGHTRLEAAKQMGLKTVPVIVADWLDEDKAKAFRLADNKTAELSSWKMSMLEDELRALCDVDMERFGFWKVEPQETAREGEAGGMGMERTGEDLVRCPCCGHVATRKEMQA